MAQAHDLSGEALLEHIWGRLFAGLLARRMAGDLLALPEARAADLIVRDTTELGGCVAAERLGLPHAAVSALATGITPGAPEWIAESLDAVRARYGLPPDPDGIMPFRYLTLQPSVRSLLALPPRLTDHLIRPVPFDGSTGEGLPPWLDVLPDRPTVYATLGTVFNRRSDIFETILAGLRDERVNLIVTVGHGQDPARFGSQPPHIRIERYIPQTRLLPRCDLVLSHGGSGTMLAALVEGLPLVILPLGADQPENARACQALGAGRALDPTTLTPELVRDAVRTVLGDAAYRRHAEQLRDALAELPGPERAATLLETLAIERRPLSEYERGIQAVLARDSACAP
jgi:UDP:flavonoid glycosyltransferase YjiC (YdhE family)